MVRSAATPRVSNHGNRPCGRDSTQPENALGARQRDIGALELAARPDHDGLLVAARGQRNVRLESGRGSDNLEITVAAASLEVSADAPAAFTPRPGER